jgi:cell division protein FtsW
MVRSECDSTSSPNPLSAGQGIALCVLALLVIGVVMVNSAGMSVDQTRPVTAESLLLSKPTVYAALAMVALIVTALLPIRGLVARLIDRADSGSTAKPSAPAASPLGGWIRHLLGLWPLWAFVCVMFVVLGSVYLPGIGKEVNHSHRWINLHAPGLDSVQPSEIAKWALILAMAWYGCRNIRHMNSFWKGLVPGLAAAGAVSAVIVLEDLGTGALLGMVACIILIAAGVRLWHVLVLAPLPLAAMGAAIVTSPYRTHRILAFLNPYEDPQGIGYHMIQSMVAVANGQFFGRGLGHGLQKFGYLPEDTTDFLFAIICEELGVFGAALVIFFYGAMLWCILGIIRREPSRFLKLVALGVMATVGLQAMINLAVVTGLGPTKGIALPLLSSGGTGWILTAASLGLVIAMDRTCGAAREVPEASVARAALHDPRSTPILPESSAVIEAPPAFVGSGAAPGAADNAMTPRETGLLFAEIQPAQPTQAPEVVVTDEAREWPPPVSSPRIAQA